MSLSWTESLYVALCPDRVGLVRASRGRQRMLDGSVTNGMEADPGSPPWAGALAALGAELAASDARDAGVTVVLSNHFVRYLLVPRNDALTDEAEASAHARHSFARVYGPVAESWEVRISACNGGPQVASAVDGDLLAGLDQTVAASGRRLVSVQPYLMAAFNRWRQELAGPLAWFVLAERGRLCLAALQRGHWSQLVNLQSDAGLTRKLPALLARQRILSGLDGIPGKVYVNAPDEEAEHALRLAGEDVRSLRPRARANAPSEVAACFEMAFGG